MSDDQSTTTEESESVYDSIMKTLDLAVRKLRVEMVNHLAAEMYTIAKDHGFHDEEHMSGGVGVGADSVDRMGKYVANLHGEVSELWEAAREGNLGGHCKKWEQGCELTCAEEELADIVIRAMDTAVGLGIDLGSAILKKSDFNRTRPHMHGKKA